MKIEITLNTAVSSEGLANEIGWDLFWKEFELNWCNQVPHWRFLSLHGVKFFKELRSLDCNQEKLWLYQQGYNKTKREEKK